MRLTHSSRSVISDDFHCTATVLHIVLIYPPRYDTCHCTVCTLISGFAWCYNKPVLSSNKLILKVLGNELLPNLFKENLLTFQLLHYYCSAQFHGFHYKFYIYHLIAVLSSFCNTSLIGRLLLFFGANTRIWPPKRKRSLDIRYQI